MISFFRLLLFLLIYFSGKFPALGFFSRPRHHRHETPPLQISAPLLCADVATPAFSGSQARITPRFAVQRLRAQRAHHCYALLDILS